MPHDRNIEFVPNQRRAPRFAMPLSVELQRQDEPASEWTASRIRDISVRGFYFFSPIRQLVGTKFKFSVPFQPESVSDKRLLRGVASVVRCEKLETSAASPSFGVAVEIEEFIVPTADHTLQD
jgi:hypothetical protein